MNRRAWVCLIAVALLACSAMGRVVLNDFVVWDDPKTIYDNPLLHPPFARSLAQMWSHSAEGLYVPLTYSAWWTIENFSPHPWAFHLVSVLAHALASVMVFLILFRIVRVDFAASLGAMLFAVHPLQVESVAWASGLKDALAGLLALAAIHQHLLQSRRSKILAAIFFTLAMLAKPSAASAIFIAIILDCLMLHRSPRSLWLWVIIAIPLLLTARIVQETPFISDVAIWKRPLLAGDAISFYLMKLFAPIRLAIDYGRSPDFVFASKWIALTACVPVALFLIALRNRTLLAALLIMIAGLIWNLGLSPFQFQVHSTVADHYLYLAMLGPALALAWLTTKSKFFPGFAMIVIVVLAGLSIRQTFIWRDSDSLLRHAIDVNPRSISARDNLGRLLGEHGDLPAAEEQFRASLAVNPDNPEALRNLAFVKFQRHDLDAAVELLFRAIQIEQQRGVDVRDDIHKLMQLQAMRNRAQTRPTQ